MRETVEWYVANRTWWERVLSEAYRAANALYLDGHLRLQRAAELVIDGSEERNILWFGRGQGGFEWWK